MDPWWNPAAEDQAIDRVHRIGQKKPVEVIRYITPGTVEEGILQLQNKKRDMTSAALSGNFRKTRQQPQERMRELLDLFN